MEQRKTFKQPTKKDFQKKLDGEKAVEDLSVNFINMVDMETDKVVVDLLHEMGYTEATEGMSLEQAEEIHSHLKKSGMFLNISKDFNEQGELVVKVSVVQTARELTFKLEGLDEQK